MKTKVFKDVGKKKLGNAGSINVFGTGSKDYPLHKAMVNHNHQEIMAKALTKEDKPGHQKSRSMMALVQKRPACPEVGDLCKEQTRERQADILELLVPTRCRGNSKGMNQ